MYWIFHFDVAIFLKIKSHFVHVSVIMLEEVNKFAHFCFLVFSRFNELIIVYWLPALNAVANQHHWVTDPLISHSRDALPTPGVTSHGAHGWHAQHTPVTHAVTYYKWHESHARRH